MDPRTVKPWFTGLQQDIVARLEAFDGQPFRSDGWDRPGGGGGLTRVIEDGNVFERGGVNFSHVMGDGMPASATAHRPELAGRRFEALGVSLVLHPRNPHCPTVHMNVRCFVALADGKAPVWWFGGGMDLTPYYPVEEDVRHFHRSCRDAVLPFGGEAQYARLKDWCDRYFFLKHRDETRGVGGLFYDDLHADGFERSFAYTRAVGDAFLDAYLPIVRRRRDTPYGERERDFQAYQIPAEPSFVSDYAENIMEKLVDNGSADMLLLRADFNTIFVSDIILMLKKITAGFDKIYNRPFPYIMSLHQTPVNEKKYADAEQYYAFHIEFYPPLRAADKIKYYAGSEMGAGAAANPLDVDECAAILRSKMK